MINLNSDITTILKDGLLIYLYKMYEAGKGVFRNFLWGEVGTNKKFIVITDIFLIFLSVIKNYKIL